MLFRSNAINTIISNDEKRQLMSEMGRKAIQMELNWEQDAKKLLEFYETL